MSDGVAERQARAGGGERGAFDWKFLVEVLISVGVTVVGIYLAARSGYEQALAFNDYQEARQVRNMLEQVDRELARNIESCRRSFAELEAQEAKEAKERSEGIYGAATTRAFSMIQAQTRVWDACYQNPLFFQVDGAVIQGLSRGYEDLAEAVKEYNSTPVTTKAKGERKKIEATLAELEKVAPALAKQVEEQRALEKRLRSGSKLY